MDSKDVYSQIRDLQSAIDEFDTQGLSSESSAALEDMIQDHITSMTRAPPDDNNNNSLACPDLTDEKTAVEEEDDDARRRAGEKTLVEYTNSKSAATTCTSLDQVSIRFSNDLSSLVDRFADMQMVKETATTRCCRQEVIIDEERQEEDHHHHKSLNDRAGSTTFAHSIGSAMVSPYASAKTTPKSRTPSSMRRRPSSASRRSSKSSRKHALFGHAGEKRENVKFRVRSYAAMMRVPDTYERLAFYDRTCRQCFKADTGLSAWVKRMKSKGLPGPMTEGYKPPPRPADFSPEPPPRSGFPRMNSSLSGSISLFLRKASQSSTHLANTTPKPSLSRSFLATSLSRLSLSRSTRPKVSPEDAAKKKKRKSSSQKPSRPEQDEEESDQHFYKQPSTTSLRLLPSWKTKSTSSSGHSSPVSSIASTFSFSSSFSARKTHRPPPPPPPQPPENRALNELCSVLPQLDPRLLEHYLAEAGGDPMVAITLAMKQRQKLAHHPHMYHNFV